MSFQETPLGCAELQVDLTFDGAPLASSPFLSPGGWTPTYFLGDFASAGVHHVTILGSSRLGGCNTGTIDAWEGTLELDARPLGTISSYTDPSVSFPVLIVTGPDGALWFPNASNNSIGRITTDGVITNFSDPSIAHPIGIAVGSDGALWFTNYGNNSIGRITTSGVVSNYTDPSISAPHGITAGPDGALWFANYNAATPSIGRITTAGVVTNFTDPNMRSPLLITTGPDGALWFSTGVGSSIGRITTSGIVTNFTDPSISQPWGIASGPDGALWFVNEEGSSIGRITTSGVVTNYPDSTISHPYHITLGPDGAMWFTNHDNDSIGRITTSGVVTNFTDHNISGPNAITTGPDGALWFTNVGDNSIGRIMPGVTATPPSYLALGDSVAAGHGVGPSTGFPDNSAAYPAIVGGDLGYSTRNYAISGACAARIGQASPYSADLKTPESCSNQGSIADEILAADTDGVSPNVITLTVGANDIQFSKCFQAELGFASPNPCSGQLFKNDLAALASNLGRTLPVLKERYPEARIVLTQYYVPVPPRSKVGLACPLSVVAYAGTHLAATATDLLAGSIGQSLLLKASNDLQGTIYSDATRIIGQLNAVIKTAAVANGAATVPLDFSGHDLCAAYAGLGTGTPWVFAPTGGITIAATYRGHVLSTTVDLVSSASCESCASDPGKAVVTLHAKVAGVLFTANLHWFANGAPHPDKAGQQAIAQRVEQVLAP